jgi:PAS domain S-box-containing protein
LEEQRWEALHSLALAPLSENSTTSLQKALQAGQLLTGCSFLALYQPDKNDSRKLNLTLYRGDVEIFPKEISLNEISHLRIPFIWEPGKRATSIFHQRAIGANLTYVATCPLDQDTPLGGILMIGDQITSPPKKIFDFMQIIAGVIVTSLKHHNSMILAQEKVSKAINEMRIFKNIKEIMSDGIIYTDENHHIININTPALITLGYLESEVANKPLEQILISEYSLSELLTQASRSQAVVQEVGEVKVHRRDGDKFLANLRVIRLPKENATAKNIILLSDLSAKEEFRNRTKQLENQAVLGEVMAIFAHEVRNPINNISMGLEVLSSSFDAEDQIHKEIDRLRIDIDRLEDLMKSVLSVSRTREYRMEQVHVLGLVESLVYRWKPRMEKFRIIPKINASDGNFIVKGDKRSLEQVFTNIIQNGINAMKDEGGTLTIRFMAEKDGFVNIDISDTGPGIPKAIMDRIFEPFFSTNKEGTGLGLAITRQIINAHNGQVNVNSVPGGTVFRIKLPRFREKSEEE